MTGAEPEAPLAGRPVAAVAGLVLVIVGTDSHQFDRLMDWLERWYASRADQPGLIVQHGYTRRPQVPGAVDFLDHQQVHAAIIAATVVVTHGGPASIIEVRRAGRLPIVVPRDPARGEHVDDHQQRFAHRLASVGAIRLCEEEADFIAALDAGLAAPDSYRLSEPVGGGDRAQAVALVGQIVEALMRRTRGTANARRLRGAS